MILFKNLPNEINDKIFLYLDFESLEKTRIFQSNYVKKVTQYETLLEAVRNGNLDNIKHLCKKDHVWDKYTFPYASINGNLDNMKWLLINGCPWNIGTFVYAIMNGCLENICWLYENKCPWDERVFLCAMLHNNPKVNKWLKNNLKK